VWGIDVDEGGCFGFDFFNLWGFRGTAVSREEGIMLEWFCIVEDDWWWRSGLRL
jgi:hypothetical protein